MTDLSDDAQTDATSPNLKGVENAGLRINLASGVASTSIWRAKAVPPAHETKARDTERNIFPRTNRSPLDMPETLKVSKLEGSVRETVEYGTEPSRSDEAACDIATNVEVLVQRAASLNELRGVIGELQNLHDFLHNEGERLEREISKYAQLSKTTTTSTRFITEKVLKFPTSQDTAAPAELEHVDRRFEETRPAPISSDENSERVRLSLNWALARPIR